VLALVFLYLLIPAQVYGIPELNISIDGPDQAQAGTEVSLEVIRDHTEVDLAGIAYDLNIIDGSTSDPLAVEITDREYSDFGWIANDGLFDVSNPVDDDNVSVTLSSMRFDTVVDPLGSAFEAGTSGNVEVFSFIIPEVASPRWIMLDINFESASNEMGQDWEQDLSGVVNLIPGSTPETSEYMHGIWVPEPNSLMFVLFGLIVTLKRK
jgi:hypothetical protein